MFDTLLACCSVGVKTKSEEKEENRPSINLVNE